MPNHGRWPCPWAKSHKNNKHVINCLKYYNRMALKKFGLFFMQDLIGHNA